MSLHQKVTVRTIGELVNYLNQQMETHGPDLPVLHNGEWGGELYPVTVVETTIHDENVLLFVEEGEPINRW